MEDGRRVAGKRLKSLRVQAGMNLRQFADAIGCSWGHVCNVESATDDHKKHHQLSGPKVYLALGVLSKALGRKVDISEITEFPAAGQDAA